MTDEVLVPRNTALFYIKRIIGLLVLLALSGVFLFSGFSKLQTQALDAFEWTFMDMGFSNPIAASVIAHLFIGLEFLTGLFLLFHIYLKQVTYPLTITLLSILSIYLVVLIIQQGNTGSCGCFGNWVYMKPLAAIWKNLLMIAACIALRYIYPIKPYQGQEWVAAIVGMIGLVAPFVASPLDTDHQPQKVSEPINMQLLYQPGKPQPYIDLRQGKHIVAFMSLTCPHCKKAAYLMQIIKKHHPDIPIFLILSGHPDNEKTFFDETHAIGLPHMLFRDSKSFTELAGPGVPAIFWINNSIVERKSNYYQLDPQVMEDWLKH